jgi:hypothetical protein
MATFIQLGDLGREKTPPRLREDLKQRHQHATAADELRTMLDTFGQQRAARLFATSSRNLRRWRDGTRRIPRAVTLVCRLMAVGAVTIEQAERAAAVPSPIRTNGGTNKPVPPAPLRAEPAPEERSASARARTAARADPGLTTAEKLCALPVGACHWPYNDPRDRDFRFCGKPTARGSYCERHALQAHLIPRPGRGHGVRIGFVVRGRHGRPAIPSALSATGAARAPISRAVFPVAHPRPLDEASPC